MSKELVALIGVVIGAIAGSVVGYFLGIRKELSDGMVSARLVRMELDRRKDPPDDAVWLEHRETLARVLAATQWADVARAYLPGADDDADAIRRSAMRALCPLAKGKRYQVEYRWAVLRGKSPSADEGCAHTRS